MSRIEYDGEPIEVETVAGDHFTFDGTWVLMSQSALEDADRVSALMHAQFDRMLCEECNAQRAAPLTRLQRMTGYRTLTCSRHGESRQEVGWRADRSERKRRERIEAEMAACPYVACECGYHEE